MLMAQIRYYVREYVFAFGYALSGCMKITFGGVVSGPGGIASS